MIDKLRAIRDRRELIGEKLGDPDVTSNMKEFMALSKEYKDLEEIVETATVYEKVLNDIQGNKEILKEEDDPDFKDMAKAELDELEPQRLELEEQIKVLLIPKDPEDAKNIVLEIRAGTGGDEAGIFAGDLYRMYLKYCERKGWKTETMSFTESSSGGYKEVVVNVTGNGVYGIMKYESGVHRVQRVPKTESQGRVHTSAASVAVLPEVDEVDVKLNPADIRTDTYRASGAGGQHVNKTESAVRLTHVPSGVVAECQDGRSQLKNRETAMKMLLAKIYEIEMAKHNDAISQKRKTLVSSGDRSAKIRTYNYPQGRVTDHRITLTLYHLDAFINGDLDMVIEPLQVAENAEKMREGTTI